MKLLTVVLVVLTILSVIGWKMSRHGYETAPYSVLQKDGPFEIREYPKMTLVSTQSNGSDGSDDGAFMRLFRYIAKENEAEEKIAMTTPVFMFSGADAKMSFVLPEEVAAEGAPVPKSSQVTLQPITMGKVAAYRYSGKWRNTLRQEAREKLAEWLKQKSLSPSGEFFDAGYDPPFTPGFLKRNEALICLQD